jgi:hypothetical protein
MVGRSQQVETMDRGVPTVTKFVERSSALVLSYLQFSARAVNFFWFDLPFAFKTISMRSAFEFRC